MEYQYQYQYDLEKHVATAEDLTAPTNMLPTSSNSTGTSNSTEVDKKIPTATTTTTTTTTKTGEALAGQELPATRRSGSITDIIANETTPKGMSLAISIGYQLVQWQSVEKVDDPPKVKSVLPEGNVKEPQEPRFFTVLHSFWFQQPTVWPEKSSSTGLCK
jgi:hypothetical protein